MRLPIAALALATVPAAAPAEMVRYDIDPEHAVVAFMVDHLGFAKVLATFGDVEGHFMYDAEARELGEVSVRVGVDSVETHVEARDRHIRGGDFLDGENHPHITFTANGGTAATETTGTVTGDLTVRGVTQPLTLDVMLNKVGAYPFGHQKEVVGVSARGALLRSDFGSTYALQGGIVGDEVDLIIEVEGIRAD